MTRTGLRQAEQEEPVAKTAIGTVRSGRRPLMARMTIAAHRCQALVAQRLLAGSPQRPPSRLSALDVAQRPETPDRQRLR